MNRRELFLGAGAALVASAVPALAIPVVPIIEVPAGKTVEGMIIDLIDETLLAQIGDTNDEALRNSVADEIVARMAPLCIFYGVHGFRVICDSRNNTPFMIENYEITAEVHWRMNNSSGFHSVGRTMVPSKELMADVVNYPEWFANARA